MKFPKFKLWDKERKVMSEPFMLTDGQYSIEFPNGETLSRSLFGMEPSRFEWLQFTGFVDREGTEIYSGDILLHSTDAPLVVEWDIDYGCWEAADVVDGTKFGLLSNAEPFRYVIDANIHSEPNYEPGV